MDMVHVIGDVCRNLSY